MSRTACSFNIVTGVLVCTDPHTVVYPDIVGMGVEGVVGLIELSRLTVRA